MVEILDSLAIWSLVLEYVLSVGWMAAIAIDYESWGRVVARITSRLHFFLRDYEMAGAHWMRGRVRHVMRWRHVWTS
jgi:hypothetical protein